MNSLPIVDIATLNKLKELGGESFLSKMILLFNENSESKICEAFKSWENHDYRALERSVHSLVSSAGNLGAEKMMNLALTIERKASLNDTNEFPLLLEKLLSIYKETSKRLQEIEKGQI